MQELGGTVDEPQWLGDGAPHRLSCREGHQCKTIPSGVKQGQGICRRCTGKVWDVFYVVQDLGTGCVKFGITSGDPRPRLRNHSAAGFRTQVRVVPDLPGDFAPNLENFIRLTLADECVKPVRGREYFPISATPLILSIAEQQLGEIGR
ncbi:GIY-YIG nuclease family protein [Streptomyces finlayi]|uniref:GIY-YIG nuclease family protein n=1 Tax=Streptomyces TaxID=1883 RepID=UPI0016279D1E|nr:GIY-YIG nuclease family protein [Streptomyces finlayi]